MPAEAAILAKALAYALDYRELNPGASLLEATEAAARQFDLGPLDEEWLLNHLTASKRSE